MQCKQLGLQAAQQCNCDLNPAAAQGLPALLHGSTAVIALLCCLQSQVHVFMISSRCSADSSYEPLDSIFCVACLYAYCLLAASRPAHKRNSTVP